MALARTAGRHGRPWKRMRQRVLNPDAGDGGHDICAWCGHPGSESVGHVIARSVAFELCMSRDNLVPIHGVEGCPHCPPSSAGKRRNCNSEVGTRTIGVDAHPPAAASRQW